MKSFLLHCERLRKKTDEGKELALDTYQLFLCDIGTVLKFPRPILKITTVHCYKKKLEIKIEIKYNQKHKQIQKNRNQTAIV